MVRRLWSWPGDGDQDPEQQQDLLIEEIKKLAVRIHLEVQQRDIRRDLAERMKFVPPDLRAGENVSHCQEHPSKIQQGRKSGKWLKVEIIAVKGSMAVVNTGATTVQANMSKLRRPLDTVDLEQLPDSRERAGAPVLWLSCESQMDVWEMFSDNSYFERYPWSARTSGCSANRPENKEG